MRKLTTRKSEKRSLDEIWHTHNLQQALGYDYLMPSEGLLLSDTRLAMREPPQIL
jgi:hypothetical protein